MSLVVNHNLMSTDVARNLNDHYANLRTSTQRLSTGQRINSAKDDAAGLAIRELQRSDLASLHQGARNANDAISMIQVADGALAIIDEKLIRMKELAEQAATGTYDSIQRLMIDFEFQAMGSEINRISAATDFNGIHLLDGSLRGSHDGSDLVSTGAMKIHFGTGNDSAEDYYYVNIPECSLVGLGLATRKVTMPETPINVESLASMSTGDNNTVDRISLASKITPMSYIPKGSKNVTIEIDGLPGVEDDIQLFTRDGYHLMGTKITDDSDPTNPNDYTWSANGINSPSDFE
ncbi:MAG: hypothetical protein IJU40_00815, partial [Desulfovibrionaceae bacterium]|nr:hypothetical protein [Desulfovibrionaceae bacterium]